MSVPWLCWGSRRRQPVRPRFIFAEAVRSGVRAIPSICLLLCFVVGVMQGLIKSLVFGVLIALIGASNGFLVRGGAEGVGRSTTRSVVLSISFIIIADMIFTYFLNR